jgi:hypothetical protein
LRHLVLSDQSADQPISPNSYIIPGADGGLGSGQRRFNWVWYSRCAASSPDFAATLTDVDGRVHRNSLPKGKMRPEIWAAQLALGQELLNVPFQELIAKTREPFLSVIHDCAAPRAALFGGRLLLVGDALTTFRPHLAMSFNQAAVDCLAVEKLVKGEMGLVEWERQVVMYGRRMGTAQIAMGDFFVFGGLTFLRSLVKFTLALLTPWWFLRRIARL